MKKLSKILSTLLAAIMVFSLFPLTSFAHGDTLSQNNPDQIVEEKTVYELPSDNDAPGEESLSEGSLPGSGNDPADLDPADTDPAGSTAKTDDMLISDSDHLMSTAAQDTIWVNFSWRLRNYIFTYASNHETYWKKAAELGITVPDSVTLTLCEDGVPMDIPDASVTVERNGAWPDDIKHIWYLPTKDENGQPIEYGELSVDYPAKPDGYYLSSENKTDYSDGSKHISANSWLPGLYQGVDFPFIWNDSENSAGLRPETLSVTLLANGVPYGETETFTLNSKGQYSYRPDLWQHLPVLDKDGKFAKYTLRFNDLPASYSITEADSDPVWSDEHGYGDSSSYYTVSSRVTQPYTLTIDNPQSVKAVVKWEGDGIGSEAETAVRPDNVVLKLLYSADNGNTWETFWGKSNYTVSGNSYQNSWELEWGGLPSVNEEGLPVIYKVEQINSLSAYETTADEPVYTTTGDGAVTHSDFVIHNGYNDNWNYAISLIWDVTGSDKFNINNITLDNNRCTAKYTLSISTQKPYSAGDLKVSIPYELFDNRDARIPTGVIPSRISVGIEGQETPDFSYTYRIDDKGTPDRSDDEIIFYNYKDVGTGNFRATIEYIFLPINVSDCSTAVLTATGTGIYRGQDAPETQVSNSITYRLDNGVTFTKAEKTGVTNVYSWNSKLGDKPDDFDINAYNYVIYEMRISSFSNNQPARFTMTDTPGEGGEVYRVWSGTNGGFPFFSCYMLDFETDKDTNTSEWTFL